MQSVYLCLSCFIATPRSFHRKSPVQLPVTVSPFSRRVRFVVSGGCLWGRSLPCLCLEFLRLALLVSLGLRAPPGPRSVHSMLMPCWCLAHLCTVLSQTQTQSVKPCEVHSFALLFFGLKVSSHHIWVCLQALSNKSGIDSAAACRSVTSIK